MLKNLPLLFVIIALTPLLGRSQSLSVADLQQAQIAVKKNAADTTDAELLLRLSQHYILKPGEAKQDMDSALLLIRKAEALSKKINYPKGICNSYYQYSMALHESGEKEKGKLYADSAIQLSQKHKLYQLLGLSYVERSRYYAYWIKDELPSKIEYTQKAIEAFVLSGDKKQQASSLQFLGDLHHLDLKNAPTAIIELKQALNLYQQVGHVELQGVYDLLGTCYMYIGDFNSALLYGLLAEKIALNLRDSSLQLCTILIRIGQTYQSLQNYDNAKTYFARALQVAEKHGDIQAIYESVANSTLCTMSKEPEKTLSFLKTISKKYPIPAEMQPHVNMMFLSILSYALHEEEGKKYFDIVFSDYDKNNAKPEDLVKMPHGILFLIKFKKYDEAEEMLKDFDALLGKSYNPILARHATYDWFMLDSLRGNHLSALQRYQRHRQLSDSIYNVNKLQQIEVTEIEFETEKKQQSINLLTKENQIQVHKIKQSEIVRNGTVTGIFVLAGFLGLLYNQYSNKRKSNRQLVARQKEIDEKNKALERLVEEKEWLLKEVHHRVKNNLQTVVSLLESQSAYLQNDALLAIQDSQNRIHAMSLIHQKLYQSDNVASIDMAAYLPELISYLKESFSIKQHIKFQLNISPIQMDVSQAIPIGLILNEAITNSIKYAFPQPGSHNSIIISMVAEPGNRVQLTVRDNGIGLPASWDKKQASGLGLKLMKGLTEDLEGQFSIAADNGTLISVSFVANTILDEAVAINQNNLKKAIAEKHFSYEAELSDV